MGRIIGDLRNSFMKCAYRSWSDNHCDLSDGYTILLPTPSDLPVFTSLAFDVISQQDTSGLREVLVIPDWPSPRFEEFCKDIAGRHSGLPIRLVPLRLKDRLAWNLTKGITTRHYTQLIRGIDETRTEYATLHDADLFLPPGAFLRTQYEACRDRQLAVFGIEPRPSMAVDGRSFVATWEMTFSIEWAKSFRPFVHRGQFAVANGRRQDFDTTLLPQYLTEASLVDWAPRHDEFFHFRYVIATYRNYLNHKCLEPMYGLKLFLIRTLIDMFDVSGWDYLHVPEHEQFLDGGFGLSQLRSHPDGIRHITEFADTLSGIIWAGVFGSDQSQALSLRLTDLLCSLDVDGYDIQPPRSPTILPATIGAE